MKFWVVGGLGLLGQEMVALLQRKKIPYVVTGHKEADILDLQALEQFSDRHAPTHILNTAAYVNVDKAESEKELAYAINVLGPRHLTAIARKKRMRLIHISTDYVFDGKKGSGYVESDAVHPINVYGETKLAGEKEVLQYEKSTVLRTASLYGSYKPGLISHMLAMLQEKEELFQIKDQISSPTYTKDVAEAIWAVRDISGLFHFVNKGEVSRYGLLLHLWHLARALQMPVHCKSVIAISQKDITRPALRPERSTLETNKIEPFLEVPIRTWEEALREYVETLC